MTPEELAEIRGQKIAEMRPIPELLAHIDAQADEIEILKMGEEAADLLILRGRQCEDQIEVLKEKLVEAQTKIEYLGREARWVDWSKVEALQDLTEDRRDAIEELNEDEELKAAGVTWDE